MTKETIYTADASSIVFGAGATKEVGARIRALGCRNVLVVTDPWHMPRALYQGSRYARDIELLAAPATASPEWQSGRARVQHLVSEAVAYLFERIHRIHGSPISCPQD